MLKWRKSHSRRSLINPEILMLFSSPEAEATRTARLWIGGVRIIRKGQLHSFERIQGELVARIVTTVAREVTREDVRTQVLAPARSGRGDTQNKRRRTKLAASPLR